MCLKKTGEKRSDWGYIMESCQQDLLMALAYKKTRPRADCGSDHELLITKFKKVGKTTRPFRYDLNQTPYDYTVEVRNRFKGLSDR